MTEPHSVVAPAATSTPLNRRAHVRQACEVEALSRPLESTNVISWGTTVVDASHSGVGLILCYPFKPGTFLALDVENADRVFTFLVCVTRVTDRSDGTWLVGCDFTCPVSADDFRGLI